MNRLAKVKKLGEKLIESGSISTDQLRIALYEQQRQHRLLGELLLELGFINENRLRDVLAEDYEHQAVNVSHLDIPPTTLALIPKEFAHRHQLLPLDFDANRGHLTLATGDPGDLIALDKLRALLGASVEIEARLASFNELAQAIEHHYGPLESVEDLLSELSNKLDATPLTTGPHHPATIIRLVDALLREAVRQEASDIHFEPESNVVRIRYRIDGILHPIRVLHTAMWSSMIIRLKILAGMNIAESRLAQDGRFSLRCTGREIDLRAASMPTLHGENFVLRILDRSRPALPLSELGLGNGELKLIKEILKKPHGLILVTGPTGSGKTTTLYSAIHHLSSDAISIMTLEDPVEYPIPHLGQTSLGDSAKLDFAEGVRALLRQDPDILLIGEIRDADTASMACRASLTGHLVLSTLHANSTVSTLLRLRDFGCPSDMLAETLVGVIAQRLVRRICPACGGTRRTEAQEGAIFSAYGLPTPKTVSQANGCPKCHGSGYRGRLALMEILSVDNAIAELIADGKNLARIRQQARRQGYRSLAEHGLMQVTAGLTTLSELTRVIELPCNTTIAP